MIKYNTIQLKARVTLLMAGLLLCALFVALPVFAQSVPPPAPDSATSSTASGEVAPGESDTDNTDFRNIGRDGGGSSGGPVIDVSATTTEAAAEEPVEKVATSTDGTGGKVGGTIFTGDATASTALENTLNVTKVNNFDAPGVTNSSTITSETDNVADLTTEDTTTSQTGENKAQGGQGLATIITGNAVSTADIINVVNTNLFNSEGRIILLSPFFGDGVDLNDFDLSYFFNEGPGNSPTELGCTLLTCLNSSSLNVLNTNVADVVNDVEVRAKTGANAATSTGEGGAYIGTGNAYASANVLNLVNTNFINSSYLLFSYNNFGDLGDDISLPDADFFRNLFANGSSLPAMNSSSYVVNNTNDENFFGTTTANALTGENTATSTGLGHGEISTGVAFSAASSFTAANQTMVGGSSVFMVFRVVGNWTGVVEGLPEGMTTRRTEYGFEIISTDSVPRRGDPVGVYNSSNFLASSTNTATVRTDVNVWAETGENNAVTENGTSTIQTGDAYATANVINLVNTNIVGRNWIFAMFNIFGDWSGNISFGSSGKPDLWIGAVAETTNPTLPNSDVVYRFTVTNRGDRSATNVVLTTTFDKNLLAFATAGDASATQTATGVSWNVGTIAQGETREFVYTARVADLPPGTSVSVPLTATVTSNRADNDVADNTEEVTITVSTPPPPPPPSTGSGSSNSSGSNGESSSPSSGGPSTSSGSGSGSGSGDSSSKQQKKEDLPSVKKVGDPNLSITKTFTIATTTGEARVDYKVVVYNEKTGGPVYGAVLTDTLYGPTGTVMTTRSWNIGTLLSREQITLTYSAVFGSTTPVGVYRNVARVTGKQNYADARAKEMTPAEAVSSVEFMPSGEVLGVATAAGGSCAPLITGFLRLGSTDGAEVLKLQRFLATDPTLYPAGLVTGYFGPMTSAAVRAFQQKYASEVLAPLGLTQPTGSVYSMTQRKINDLACAQGMSPVASVLPAPATVPAYTYTPPPLAPAPKPKPAPAPVASQGGKLFSGLLRGLFGF